MITLKLSFVQFEKGKSLWKHNNSLLYDKQCIDTIKAKIDGIKKQYALPVYNLDQVLKIPDDQVQFMINDQLFLETLLIEIRGKSISFSSYKKKETEKREKELISKIKLLEANLSQTNNNEIEILKEELNTIRINKMHGILVRSRAKIIEDDERPTNFFCNLDNITLPVKSCLS